MVTFCNKFLKLSNYQPSLHHRSLVLQKMEFHTNENCCLVDQVINNQSQKYEILSSENVDLHNILIKSKETVTQMECIIEHLRNVLEMERQINLQSYIKEQTYQLQRMNPEFKDCKLRSKEAANDKANYTLLSKYNELLNLVEERSHIFVSDLDLFRSLNVKHNTKLKVELTEMHNCISDKLELYQWLQNNLFRIRKGNINCRKELQAAIQVSNLEQAIKVNNMKTIIMDAATNAANVHSQEAINAMKNQLEERDKLVIKLREEQTKIEAYVEKQEKEFQIELQNHKEEVDELKKQLSYCEHNYQTFQLHRIQKCRGIPDDIANIRKTIKEIKNKFKGH